ncbi:MAG: hypothetical protein P8Y45_13125 [Exilibacterium sp.]
MADIEKIVEEALLGSIDNLHADKQYDLRKSLAELGVSSLQLVMVVTEVCEMAGVELTTLTEQDVSKMKSPLDIVNIIQKFSQQGEKDDVLA